MKAGARLAVERYRGRDVVVDQRAGAPFSIRQCGGRVLLASSAAAPVGGDELEFTVEVGSGARADIGSVAASMVWPGPDGAWSSSDVSCTVDRGARLDLWLEPTISVAGSRHRAATTVRLAADASCRVVEEVVLGRTSEPSGRLEQSLRVERDGLPVVHHDEAFGPDLAGRLSSASTGAARYVLTAVVVGIDPGDPVVRVDNHCAAAWLPVAADAAAAMAVGLDRPAALSLLAEVNASFA